MTWDDVARKEFQDAVRSRWLWGLSLVFLLLVTAMATLLSVLPKGFISLVLFVPPEQVRQVSAGLVLFALNGSLVTPLVPLIALVVSYGAVSHERETGSLKVLLALPHSRADVVVGKLVGRAATIGAAVVVGFLLPGVVMAATVPFAAVEYLGYVALVVLLATTFVAIGVGISAAAGSQQRALIATLAFYLVFITLWFALQSVGFLAMSMLAGGWPGWMPLSLQETVRAVRVANPTGAFKVVSGAWLSGTLFAPAADRGLQLAAVAMLAFWLTAPIAVGLRRFEAVDL